MMEFKKMIKVETEAQFRAARRYIPEFRSACGYVAGTILGVTAYVWTIGIWPMFIAYRRIQYAWNPKKAIKKSRERVVFINWVLS